MVQLGDGVTDSVSGFKGVVIGRTNFLNGCTRVGVQPAVGSDGKLPDVAWFDEPQVIVTEPGKVKRGPVDVGGPMVSTPTQNIPR